MLFFTIIALGLAIKSSAAANLVGILAGATALLQMVIGFPLKNVIESGEGGGERGMDPAEILAEMYHIEYGHGSDLIPVQCFMSGTIQMKRTNRMH